MACIHVKGDMLGEGHAIAFSDLTPDFWFSNEMKNNDDGGGENEGGRQSDRSDLELVRKQKKHRINRVNE